METIGHQLKIARISHDISQEFMAHKLGITQAAYSKIETGQTQITVERLIEICELLSADPAKIISGSRSK